MSSIVAIKLHANGYNATYAHNTVSFQSALMDALLQLRRGAVANAMVCAHDEMTPSYHALLCKGGFLAGKKAAECAVSLMLATHDNGRALCEVAGMRMLYRPTDAERQQALESLLETNGISEGGYTLTDGYPELFGVNYTTPALDLYAAAHLMGQTPTVVRYCDENHFSLILLKPCGDC